MAQWGRGSPLWFRLLSLKKYYPFQNRFYTSCTIRENPGLLKENVDNFFYSRWNSVEVYLLNFIALKCTLSSIQCVQYETQQCQCAYKTCTVFFRVYCVGTPHTLLQICRSMGRKTIIVVKIKCHERFLSTSFFMCLFQSMFPMRGAPCSSLRCK